jgi:hypothetical protein
MILPAEDSRRKLEAPLTRAADWGGMAAAANTKQPSQIFLRHMTLLLISASGFRCPSLVQGAPETKSANVTIFVEYKATVITHKSGIAAKRVNKPASTRLPQMISTVPTKGAIACGQGIPIFAKRPTPRVSGNKNF